MVRAGRLFPRCGLPHRLYQCDRRFAPSQASVDAVLDAARKASGWDPNPETRDQIGAMLESNDTEALNKAFGHRIAFGTAGPSGPGRWSLRPRV